VDRVPKDDAISMSEIGQRRGQDRNKCKQLARCWWWLVTASLFTVQIPVQIGETCADYRPWRDSTDDWHVPAEPTAQIQPSKAV
jgi:hypothetical protein